MSSTITVAALYIDPRGPYPKMEGVDCWDEARDARKYAGPWPVVAHPPCGPWGRLRHLAKHDDPTLGIIAVAQVRAYGGVLEHPRDSRLFRHCGMPHPGEFLDGFGGQTLEVRQVEWGHCAEKRTWLYIVGSGYVERPPHPGRVPTHQISRDANRARRRGYTLKRTGAKANKLTPPLFAEYLVRLARSAAKVRAA